MGRQHYMKRFQQAIFQTSWRVGIGYKSSYKFLYIDWLFNKNKYDLGTLYVWFIQEKL